MYVCNWKMYHLFIGKKNQVLKFALLTSGLLNIFHFENKEGEKMLKQF